MSRIVAPFLGVTMLLGSLTAAAVIGPARSLAGPQAFENCPPANNLIGPHPSWKRHQLAPGVSLAETTLGRHRKRLKLSVVRVNLRNRHAVIGPLHHAISTRHRLSKLAARPHLLAATNGTYFDFGFGAPTVPFIGARGPVVLSRRHAPVAGISVRGRAQDGDAWLVGRAVAPSGGHRLGAINEVAPPHGLSVYTPAWGTTKVPLPLLAESRAIRAGRIVSGPSRRRIVPSNGDLLVATTPVAAEWLNHLRQGSDLTLRYHAKTDAAHPFRQAYGVGTQVVATAHHIRTGLYCRQGEIYAARTDFAWRDHGRRLILATIESPRGSESHGVDENQMSEVMVRLGAARSYALDGGGSTELVARLPGTHKLSIRTPGRAGHERRIPLGIGVYSYPKPVGRPHHKHHGKGNPAPSHRQRCLLGLLPASLCH